MGATATVEVIDSNDTILAVRDSRRNNTDDDMKIPQHVEVTSVDITTEKLQSDDSNCRQPYFENNDNFGSFAVEYPINEQGCGVTWSPVKAAKEATGKQLVVVLLGWAGAQDKHLAKYSDLYLSKGCIIVRFIATPKVVMFNHGNFPEVATYFIKKMKQFNLQSNPLFFHIFSNGGGFTYSYILAELSLTYPKEGLDIRGTIFDSAPAARRIGSYFRALINIFEPYNGFRYLMASVMVVLLILATLWMQIKMAFRFCITGDIIGVDASRPIQNWLSRLSQFRNHHFLFIYSDADDIIRADLIEKFANFVERTNRVKYLKFTDSLHVQHYRKYPNEYFGAVTEFMSDTLTSDTENQTMFPQQY